jgi:hypothetical protein
MSEDTAWLDHDPECICGKKTGCRGNNCLYCRFYGVSACGHPVK